MLCLLLYKNLYQEKLRDFKKPVLVVVSQAAAEAKTSKVYSLSQEIRMKIKHLSSLGKSIYFQWMPSHLYIAENEKTDTLAKKAAKLQPRKVLPNVKSANNQ